MSTWCTQVCSVQTAARVLATCPRQASSQRDVSCKEICPSVVRLPFCEAVANNDSPFIRAVTVHCAQLSSSAREVSTKVRESLTIFGKGV